MTKEKQDCIDAEVEPTPETQALVPVEQVSPYTILDNAREWAVALQDVIKSKPKPVMINGEQYLEFEDWMTLGRFAGLTVAATQTRPITIGNAQGWESHAVVLNKDGMVVSEADSMCMNDEPRWNNRPQFQLRSMAQTRSCSKALRNVLAYVVVMAGYKPTPAEEMDGVKPDQLPPPPKAKQPAPVGTGTDSDVISLPQAKRFYAIARSAGKSDDVIKAYLMFTYNIDSTKKITKYNYDAACQWAATKVSTQPEPEPPVAEEPPPPDENEMFQGS